MSQREMNRRAFLLEGSKMTLGGAALLAGCGDPEAPLKPADMGRDASLLDMMLGRDMADAGADLGEDLGAEEMRDDVTPDEGPRFTKPPFLQLLGLQTARLRFETRQEAPLSVRLERRGQSGREYVATSDWREIAFDWPLPTFKRNSPYPDDAGFHNLQEVRFEELEQGAIYDWVVHLGNGQEQRGAFQMGRTPGEVMRLGWISDTMMPNAAKCSDLLANLSPDLVFHGGDLQYMTNPLDTWSGFFHAMSPLTSRAAFHTCLGNHEFEGPQEEFMAQYVRSFEGHGFQGSNAEYAYVDFAGVRFLLLNSEGDLFDAQSMQRAWLLSQLEAVRDSSELRFAVVAFHRPYFTFSKSTPRFDARELLHPMMRDFGVPLVFTGHNHCYERFQADDVTYIMDGGGGALLYSPDHNRDEVLQVSPGDEELRKASHYSNGVTLTEIAPDGTITLARHALDIGEVDRVTLG